MSYLLFWSYARENRAAADDEQRLQKLVEDVVAEVRQLNPPPTDEVSFFDTSSITLGDEWPAALGRALATSRTCIALYSPSYFNSTWCGREFHVFRERCRAWMKTNPGHRAGAGAIVPVLWINVTLPSVVSEFQTSNDGLPPEYGELGLRQLMRLNMTPQYNRVVTRIAERLVAAAREVQLSDLQTLGRAVDVPSAFTAPSRPGERITVTGGPSRACFVFLAARRHEFTGVKNAVDAYGETDGWSWRPFMPAVTESVGALAQQVTGQMGVRFQELPCDTSLEQALREARANDVPTLVIADAWTATLPAYRAMLSTYDELTLSNCGVLVPWNEADVETAAAKPSLLQALGQACPQKMATVPPNHYWDSITSHEALRDRTVVTLDEVRMRITQIMLNRAGEGNIRRVESTELADAAAAQGIAVQAQPHLDNTRAPGPSP